MLFAVVKTSGVNVSAVLATAAAVAVVMSFLLGILAWLFRAFILGIVDKAISAVLARLDKVESRLDRVEAHAQGRREALAEIAAAGHAAAGGD